MHNTTVKGTRRPLAVLKVCFLSGLAASLGFLQRRALYLYVKHLDTSGEIMSHLKPSWLDAWRFAAEAHNTQRVPDADLPY